MKNILFDLDGTLCDSSLGIVRCFNYSFEKTGLPTLTKAQLRECIGPPLLDSFVRFHGGDIARGEEGVRIYRERYSVLGWQEYELYPGVRECLVALKDAGYKICLATSKPQVFAEKILKKEGLDVYFDGIVGSRLDNSLADKKQIILAAMELLGISEKNTFMVGDRKQDMIGALGAGVIPVGIRVGFAEEGELENAGAKYIASDFFRLKELLLSL